MGTEFSALKGNNRIATYSVPIQVESICTIFQECEIGGRESMLQYMLER